MRREHEVNEEPRARQSMLPILMTAALAENYFDRYQQLKTAD